MLYLKAYLWHTEPFRKKSNGSWVSFGFLDNYRLQMAVCVKMISWVRNVLSIARAHMSLGTFWVAVLVAVLAAGVVLMSILQAYDRAKVTIPAGDCFSTYIS